LTEEETSGNYDSIPRPVGNFQNSELLAMKTPPPTV